MKRLNLAQDEVIRENNILDYSIYFTLGALKRQIEYIPHIARNIYYNLLTDLRKKNTQNYKLSNGYDIVQTCACFLTEHIGEKLTDMCCCPSKKDYISIATACLRLVGREVKKIWKTERTIIDLQTLECVLCNDTIEKKEDYTRVDIILEKMHLTKEEQETLDCYMACMHYIEISKFCNVEKTTIWYRRKRIQQKFLKAIEELGLKYEEIE